MQEMTTELKAVEQQLLELGDKFLEELDAIIKVKPNEVLALVNIFDEQDSPKVEFSIPVIESLVRCYNLKRHVAYLNRKQRLMEEIEAKQKRQTHLTESVAIQQRLITRCETYGEFTKAEEEVTVLRQLEEMLTKVEGELNSLYNQLEGKVTEVKEKRPRKEGCK